MADTARTDKWLWAVRLFKTRSLAAEACAAGQVKRRGHALKASSALQIGDELLAPYPDGPGTRSVTVVALIEKRVGAAEAQECYREDTPQDVINTRAVWHQNRSEGVRGRPTKKDRREMDRIRGFVE